MSAAYTLLSCRNALVDHIYAPFRRFVPLPSSKKLSIECDAVSIATPCRRLVPLFRQHQGRNPQQNLRKPGLFLVPILRGTTKGEGKTPSSHKSLPVLNPCHPCPSVLSLPS